jgi:hypothetical protein
MSWLRGVAAVAAAAALIGWSLVETRRLSRLLGEQEVGAREARREAAAGAEEQRRLEGRVLFLERELEAALNWQHALGEAMSQQIEAREQAAVARAAGEAIVSVPPPLGVQRCLQVLRECLVAEGHDRLRLLRARALHEFELHDVECLDIGPDAVPEEIVVAARLSVRLDRARGELYLEFRDGFRRVQGARVELPPGGWQQRLKVSSGRMWEERLPFLVRAEGSYPDDAERQPEEPRLDAQTRAVWLERFDLLLRDAGTDLRLRVAGFAALQEARFRTVRLFGYDRGNLLALAADCADLAVEVDAAARIVSLVLRDGTLRREGVQSTIHREGYRMLLPNVTPERADELMYGMVVRK